MKPVVFLLVLLVTVVASGLWWFQSRFIPVVYTEDAVQVLAYAAHELLLDNPDASQSDIEQMIKTQHNASNINLRINSDGRAVDPFGTPFRVVHEARAGLLTTTVTSAGPDGRFETSDDIRYRHKEKAEF